jgi:hypothetical protein
MVPVRPPRKREISRQRVRLWNRINSHLPINAKIITSQKQHAFLRLDICIGSKDSEAAAWRWKMPREH